MLKKLKPLYKSLYMKVNGQTENMPSSQAYEDVALKLNEAIDVITRLEEQQKVLNKSYNDRIAELAGEVINLKHGHTLFEKKDAP